MHLHARPALMAILILKNVLGKKGGQGRTETTNEYFLFLFFFVGYRLLLGGGQGRPKIILAQCIDFALMACCTRGIRCFSSSIAWLWLARRCDGLVS